jgi:hypothetical protein
MKNEVKPYKQLLKEMFTKTFDQRYAASSRKDKVAYWIFICIIFSAIAYLLL